MQLLIDKELSVLIRELYFIVLDKLCTEHFLTALDIAQSGTLMNQELIISP